jgi:SPP1 family predicted phage head-tail adaptor
MALNIGAGKYRTRVVIEQPTNVVGDYNDPQLSWATYITRWSELDTGSGREFVRAQQVIPELTAVVRMRSDTGTRAITPRMRIRYGSRYLQIAGVSDDGELRQEVVIWTTEVV